MASTDVELEQQLKEAGKQLSHPPATVDELLPVLDQAEKLLSKVDQSPKKSMLDALKPSMKALIQDGLSRHSDVDVKVAVASCISEITRITAPDAPYNDDQMRDVFQLIVSSFEHLADESSRSYNKRASILETVSKVRSCVIMLDLECDGLIVEMFEHFLKSVRDHHLESIYSSMENIMVLVLEESEEISVEMLKPLLASVKKDSEGVLPVSRKLGEGVLLKSAAKLRPYLMPILKSLGDTLDNYSQVVASICDGTTTAVERNDENTSGQPVANESKSVKGSLDEAQQADESKLTTASSDHTEQVVKEGPCPEEADPTLDRSPKSVMSNGINVTGNEEASVDQELSKKPEEPTNESHINTISKEDTEQRKSDSAEPSDSSHVEGEKEADKQPEAHRSPVKESSMEAINPSEIEKESDAQVSSPKAIESDIPDECLVKKAVRTKKKTTPQQDEVDATNAASPSQSASLPEETRSKKTGRSKNKGLTLTLTQEDSAPEGTSDSDVKPQKRVGKKAVVKLPAIIGESDGEDSSDSDAKPLKKPSKKVEKLTKQSGKKAGVGDSEAKKGKQSGKKADAGDSEAKKAKNSGKKSDGADAEGKASKQSVKKAEDSDSDTKPLKHSVKKGVETKPTKHIDEEEESDSETKPLKFSAKKGNTSNSADVKSSSSKKKDDGKKRGRGKSVAEKDQAKPMSDDDEMDSSPKSATKSAKGEDNLKETPGTSSKRKRATGKDKESDPIKYDKSLVGLKVKVWWPEDKMYYEGVVEHFDAAKKKHKVLYVDGDEEILNLKTQKWEILEEFSARDEKQTIEVQSPEASPESPKKKKSKTDSAPSASQEKTKDSTKRVGGTSLSSKSKGSSSKSARKPEPEPDNKPKESQKATGKPTNTPTATKETDDEPPKPTTKTSNKSKGKTPQSGSKSNTNGPTKAKPGSSNVKEAEKSADAVKNLESTKGGLKSGKKRKKRN